MPRTCTLCNHTHREDIERALLANEPFRHIASRFGSSTATLQRHKAEHLTRSLTLAREAETVARADSLLSDIRNAETLAGKLYCSAGKILDLAIAARDPKSAIDAIKAAVGVHNDSGLAQNRESAEPRT
jgi:hypothetical protein